MPEEIQLELTFDNKIRMLHSDAVNLDELGAGLTVVRASHVEFSAGGDVPRGWYVQSAKTLTYLATGFTSRAQALAWEKDYYSPTGAGWKELTEGGN